MLLQATTTTPASWIAAILSLLFVLVFIGLFIALFVAIIRYIWKKGSSAK